MESVHKPCTQNESTDSVTTWRTIIFRNQNGFTDNFCKNIQKNPMDYQKFLKLKILQQKVSR